MRHGPFHCLGQKIGAHMLDAASVSKNRSSFEITVGVWKALFLREALTRLFSGRALWFWLLAEPVFHAVYLILIFTVIRVRTVGGIQTPLWILLGLLGFFMFQRTATQAQNGVNANRSLFAYRQVKPVDGVLVRSLLEACTMAVVCSALLIGLALYGYDVIPADPLAAGFAFTGLWLLGTGWGLVTSVIDTLLPELDRVLGMAMKPLYLVSGVMLPIASVPEPYRDWLMLNPVAHGLEALRLGFAPHYHATEGLSLAYLFCFALVLMFFGLALHQRFAWRLAAR